MSAADPSKHVIAVYPGTFDPITNGHLDILARALHLFDHILVTLAVNPRKQPLFTVDERVGFIRDAMPEHAHRLSFAAATAGLLRACVRVAPGQLRSCCQPRCDIVRSRRQKLSPLMRGTPGAAPPAR